MGAVCERYCRQNEFRDGFKDDDEFDMGFEDDTSTADTKGHPKNNNYYPLTHLSEGMEACFLCLKKNSKIAKENGRGWNNGDDMGSEITVNNKTGVRKRGIPMAVMEQSSNNSGMADDADFSDFVSCFDATSSVGDDESQSGLRTRPQAQFSFGAAGPLVEWFNELLSGLWPNVTDYVEGVLKKKIEQKLKEKLPFTIEFNELDFGRKPLELENIRVQKYTRTNKEGLQASLVLRMMVNYIGDSNIDILLPGGIHAGVSEIALSGGPLCVELSNMLPSPPFFSGIQIYFINPPKVDLKWTGIVGVIEGAQSHLRRKTSMLGPEKEIESHQAGGLLSKMDVTTKLQKKILETIEGAITQYTVLPARISYIMNHDAHSFAMKDPMPTHVLEFKLIAARNLIAADWSLIGKGKSDPYCEVSVGGEKWVSPTVDASLNPVWRKDNSTDFFVYEHTLKHLQISAYLYDEDYIQTSDSPDFLGGFAVTADTIIDNGGHGKWHQIVVPTESGGPMGPGGKPSEVHIAAILHPVLLDRTMLRLAKPKCGVTCFLAFFGISKITNLTYEPKMSVRVDIVCGSYSETTGDMDVPEPKNEDDDGAASKLSVTESETDRTPNKRDTELSGKRTPFLREPISLIRKKTEISVERSFLWKLEDYKQQSIDITLLINKIKIRTRVVKLENIAEKEGCTSDGSLIFADTSALRRGNDDAPRLFPRIQVRVIDRSAT